MGIGLVNGRFATLRSTNIAFEILPFFPGKTHQHGGFFPWLSWFTGVFTISSGAGGFVCNNSSPCNIMWQGHNQTELETRNMAEAIPKADHSGQTPTLGTRSTLSTLNDLNVQNSILPHIWNQFVMSLSCWVDNMHQNAGFEYCT